jgi:hypothetical protein
MSVQRLSWREIGLLEEGQRVIVLEEINVPADPSDPDPDLPVPDVIVPANSSAVVCMNTLSENGTMALMPDDLGLRAELREVGSEAIFFLPTPFGDSPPPEDADVWNQLGPVGQMHDD